MEFKVRTKLSDHASFLWWDFETEITYFISNENNPENLINLVGERNGIFLDEEFETVDDLLLYLKKEGIDIEKFREYDYENERYADTTI